MTEQELPVDPMCGALKQVKAERGEARSHHKMSNAISEWKRRACKYCEHGAETLIDSQGQQLHLVGLDSRGLTPCAAPTPERYIEQLERSRDFAVEEHATLVKQNANLLEQLAEARKDTERLDWLEQYGNLRIDTFTQEGRLRHVITAAGTALYAYGHSMRAAIDDAKEGR